MLTIAPYHDEDRPAVETFAQAIQDFERVFTPALRPGEEIAPAYVDYLLKRAGEVGGLILVAAEDERPVGFVAGWPEVDDDWLVDETMRRHGYVSDLYVVPDRRRHGVATALLQAIEAELRERGCRRLRICSKAMNAGAISTYRRAGFLPYEMILDKTLPD